jgi:hypothetical protein
MTSASATIFGSVFARPVPTSEMGLSGSPTSSFISACSPLVYLTLSSLTGVVSNGSTPASV